MHRQFALIVAAFTAAGCKSSSPSAGTPVRPPEPSAFTTAPVKWTGTFQPQQQRTSSLGPTSKNRASGTVALVPVNGQSKRTNVQISLNASVQPGATMAWGVFAGRCGSGSGLGMPLVATTALPMLEAARNGGARLAVEIAMELPKSGTYHLNVFWGNSSSDLSDVLTCANLRAEEMTRSSRL